MSLALLQMPTDRVSSSSPAVGEPVYSSLFSVYFIDGGPVPKAGHPSDLVCACLFIWVIGLGSLTLCTLVYHLFALRTEVD